MMTSSKGNISALLAICAGNSPVPGEFHAQRPVIRSFDVFFDLRLNKRLSKQSWAGDLIRYRAPCDVNVMESCRISILSPIYRSSILLPRCYQTVRDSLAALYWCVKRYHMCLNTDILRTSVIKCLFYKHGLTLIPFGMDK